MSSTNAYNLNNNRDNCAMNITGYGYTTQPTATTNHNTDNISDNNNYTSNNLSSHNNNTNQQIYYGNSNNIAMKSIAKK